MNRLVMVIIATMLTVFSGRKLQEMRIFKQTVITVTKINITRLVTYVNIKSESLANEVNCAKKLSCYFQRTYNHRVNFIKTTVLIIV